MNPIFQGLDQGYSPEDILGYISKAIPQFIPSIKKAKNSGYTVQQILGFLAKNFDTEDRRGLSESARHAVNQRKDAEMTKHGLKMAATAVAAPLAASAVGNALSRALPTGLKNVGSGLLQTAAAGNVTSPVQTLASGLNPEDTTLQAPQEGIQLQPSSFQPPVNAANITQPTQPVQPEVKNIDFSTLIKTHSGFLKKIDELKNSGNNVETISAYFRKFAPSQSSKLEKDIGKSLEEVIGQYLSQPTNLLTKPTELVEKQLENSENMQIQEKISPKIEKSSLTLAPQGIGEVKEIRNGQALIDVDGKIHKVKESELVPSPLPQKDLADIYDELLKGIEKETGQEVSRNVNVAAYDPETNSLAYIPHQGGLYIYDDISDEDKDILMNSLATRKTTGSNHIGAWKEGTVSPMGAQMSQLIKKLQSDRGGKGNEYSRKYEMIYRALAPAEEAHREKKRKKK